MVLKYYDNFLFRLVKNRGNINDRKLCKTGVEEFVGTDRQEDVSTRQCILQCCNLLANPKCVMAEQ